MNRAFAALLLATGLTTGAQAAWQDAAATPAAQEVEIPTRGFQKGQFLPDVELPRIDGQGTLRLADFAGTFDKPGKKLLLIHFASW